MKPMHATPSRRRGFSMLEVVAVVAILTLVAGAAVPLVAKSVERAARESTRKDLEAIAGAALEHVRDTGVLPTSASELGSASTTTGWSGPYLGSATIDTRSGRPSHEVDGWSRAYRFQMSARTLLVESAGPDASFGTADDLSTTIDATPILRELTLAELEVLNRTVLAYNALYQITAPLPSTWSLALGRLVTTGLLPSSSVFERDAFGDEYVGVPVGASPLVMVGSRNLGTP